MVALLAEGVGRNAVGICFSAQTPKVALLAEGVGRNEDYISDNNTGVCSRPPRGGRG